jgi:hypothetical protein
VTQPEAERFITAGFRLFDEKGDAMALASVTEDFLEPLRRYAGASQDIAAQAQYLYSLRAKSDPATLLVSLRIGCCCP